MNYDKKNPAALKQYGLRRRKALETIQESDVNGSSNEGLAAPDTFDLLFNSPMKQQVTLKPLSHWGKKLAELDKPTGHAKKIKDLYEMSSPDESSPYIKTRKKPKPRKKKENSNLFDGLLAKSYKSVQSKPEFKPRVIKKAVNLMKMPLNVVEKKVKTKNWVTSSSKFPVFGLTSTPDKSYWNEPSFFNLCSPIVNEKIRQNIAVDQTPKTTNRYQEIHFKKLLPNDSANNVSATNESSVSNQISENELLGNAFSGFSYFAEDPQRHTVSGKTIATLPTDDFAMKKVSLRVQSPVVGETYLVDAVQDDPVTYKDKNVTLRRKCKRSHESQSNNTAPTAPCVLPTASYDSMEYVTVRRPKRKTNSNENGTNKGSLSDYDKPQLYEVEQSNISTVKSKSPQHEIMTDAANEIKEEQPARTHNNSRVYEELKLRGKKIAIKNDSNTEVSPYFPTEVKSSSDSSFVMDTPPKQDTTLNVYMTKWHNQSKKLCDSNLNKTPACCNSSMLLKGGKQHKRARIVSRQFQAGRLTLHNAKGRGRGYETFVGELLEMQPDFEGTLLNAVDRTRLTIVKPNNSAAFKRISCANKRKSHGFLQLSRFIEKGNKTVHFAEDESPLPEVGWQCSIRGQRRVSRIEKPLNVSNLSVRGIHCDEYETTVLRTAFGIQDSSAVDIGETWTAKDAILSRCNQTEPVNFSEHFNELTLPECKKIGEGVYGEVFMYSSILGTTVFKVIPIEGDLLVNDEPQKTFIEIISEIVISMELSNLRHGKEQQSSGYAELRRTWCVQGEYPDFLVELWNDYDLRKGSENDSPTMFPVEQLYIILELAHGGLDLEAFVFRNAAQSLSAFRQAAFSLAVAERALEFEHRDFHWGNVLVSETTDKYVTFALDGQPFQIPSEGVKVTIIDFTLSRITFEGCSVFNDLSVDPTLFTSEGDYQFEIYRMMREETKNNWEQFTPRTNVFWLHYTLDKMLRSVRYSRIKSKPHSTAMRKLKKLKDCTLEFSDSAKFAVSIL